MKTSKLLLFISLTLFFSSGKKSDPALNNDKDEFSFMYNGQKYNYSVTGNIANAGAGRRPDGTPFIHIDMVTVFGGRIYFDKTGCAYLEPEFSTVLLQPGCMLSERTSIGTAVPIDSQKVFIYGSGLLNLSFSNCVDKSGVDFVTGLPYHSTICAAMGTFQLTLKNKNNSTINITNGIVKFHQVQVP